jgi:hypothetical protein
MPAGISGPERSWLRPDVLDDIVVMLERGSADADVATPGASRDGVESRGRVGARLDRYIDALQDRIVGLMYGDVPDDARELDEQSRR